MTEADGTPPSAEETANYTERLLAALTRLLGDDDSARASMEATLERARAGNALRGVSEEALEEYLQRVCARVEKHIDELTLVTLVLYVGCCYGKTAVSRKLRGEDQLHHSSRCKSGTILF